jgi:hypothetical protein
MHYFVFIYSRDQAVFLWYDMGLQKRKPNLHKIVLMRNWGSNYGGFLCDRLPRTN